MLPFQMLFAILTKAEKRRAIYVLLVVLVMAMLETLSVASIFPFLSELEGRSEGKSNPAVEMIFENLSGFWDLDDTDYLPVLGGICFLLVAFSAAFRVYAQQTLNFFIEYSRHSISSRLLENYLSQSYEFFINQHSAELTKRVISEVDQLVLTVIRPLCLMIGQFATLIAMLAFIIYLDPRTAAAAGATIGITYAIVYIGVKKAVRKQGVIRVAANRKRFIAVSEALSGVKAVKLFRAEKAQLLRYSAPSEQFARSQATYQTISQVPRYAIEAIAIGGLVTLAIALNASSSEEGGSQSLIPLLGAFGFAAYRMQPAVQAIFQGFVGLSYGQAALTSILADLEGKSENTFLLEPQNTPINRWAEQSAGATVEIKSLSYSYPQSDKQALQGINLLINPGEVVGIIGTTGAGKTTFVDVMLGLLRPSDGVVKIDGRCHSATTESGFGNSLGYVPQEVVLTDATIAENIAIGIPVEEIDQRALVRASKLAGIYEFFSNSTERGFGEYVGDRGVKLSGGQRQRVGIARALYKLPNLLVLDEATSALDEATETQIVDALRSLKGTLTIILIAHRTSTLSFADRIYELRNGALKLVD